ncbi:CAP domain-containing protein [Winogradskyella marincola]|uniref:CAP domain-containing protein n=1 Tax=Winogradskyella marincola TaxID=3037795 RepID=A0ABT6G3Q8_9FLAO|nr:CAP domain-containing protein [Winogradskyella sp. YYF002]MDG4716680.1 CAP domain-containing protein [Winogradskyella sp. YYF002]
MKKALVIIVSILITSFNGDNNITIDKKEALKAFDLLNNIRVNPKEYENIFPFLKDAKVQKTKLVWNDTLALVAEKKAFDMADRNFYAHVDPSGYGINHYINKSGYKLNADWLEDKKANYFESIAVDTPDGYSAISIFINDHGVPSLGHRTHLLGLDEWNASLKDIGIGFVRREIGSDHKIYVCLIIAKHEW